MLDVLKKVWIAEFALNVCLYSVLESLEIITKFYADYYAVIGEKGKSWKKKYQSWKFRNFFSVTSLL